MEAVQFQWFHWQWNHNETKGLRDFTVHVVDSSQTSHTLNLEDHKSIQKGMEQWKQTYLCFNIKWRKLQVDKSKSVWYEVEQYSERTERNVGTGINNGPPTGMHSQVTTIDVQ